MCEMKLNRNKQTFLDLTPCHDFSSAQSEKTCRRPELLPPTNALLVGWNAVTERTVLRFSLSLNECKSSPLWWNTCTLRGLDMLPTTKQSSCLGSQTAESLLSQRPVCMLCLKVRTKPWSGMFLVQTQTGVSGLTEDEPDF